MHNCNSLACTNTAPLCSENSAGNKSWSPEGEWASRECPGAQVKGCRGAGKGTNPCCVSFVQKSHKCRLCTQKRSSKVLEAPTYPLPEQGQLPEREVGLCWGMQRKETFLSHPGSPRINCLWGIVEPHPARGHLREVWYEFLFPKAQALSKSSHCQAFPVATAQMCISRMSLHQK